MTFRLALRFIARGKTRFVCAAAGVAAAAGIAAFSFWLAETNSAQAPALAAKAAAPWTAWTAHGPQARRGAARTPAPDLKLTTIDCSVDYRPGGSPIQGPPMRATLAAAPESNPWEAAPLESGRWPLDSSPSNEVCVAKSAFGRFARQGFPPIGSELKFVGANGTMRATICGYLAESRLPPGFPGVFANKAAFADFAGEKRGSLSLWRKAPSGAPEGVLGPESESVAAGFKNDDMRKMDYARPLTIAAAILTALCLIANSLLLSVEANRRDLALLRVAGAGRFAALKTVAAEALLSGGAGCAAGCMAAAAALAAWTRANPESFPAGAFMPWRTAAAIAATVLVASLAAAFACGYAAFAAVEVWGASLMRSFVPSPEWPDAIVSLLPGGTSEYDIEKIAAVPGVARASQLYPLQLPFEPLEEMKTRGGPPAGPRAGRKQFRNALVLGAEWLPRFKMKEGSWEECSKAIAEGDRCVISETISNARNLHKGDSLELRFEERGGKPETVSLEIAGVADVNWHMVTSRGLVRGLNGAPAMTDGPVFVSLETAQYLDSKPPFRTRMTHAWVEYDRDFLAAEGVFPAGRKVEEAVKDALGDPRELTVRLHARDEIADGTLAHGSDLIGQMARIPVFFLAVLSIGFAAMTVANADASRRTLEALRAVGATRAQLAWLLVKDALSTAAKGIAAGLPAGAAIGWLFSMETAKIWPGLPKRFDVPWRAIAEGTAAAVAFVLAVSTPAALAMIKKRPAARRSRPLSKD